MNLVPAAITRAVARQGLLTRQNAPDILFVAGVVGSVTSTVLACRATLKVSDVLTDTQSNLDVARSIPDEKYEESGESRQKDMILIRMQGAGKLTKLYAPSVVLGVASIYCLTRSHNILQERNLALTAAYTAVDQAFNAYRERVVEKYGEEEDRNLRFPVEELEEYNPDTDKTEIIQGLSDAHEESMYARFFDSKSPSWNTEPELNYIFLRCQQNWANDLLKARGHLFLNEVYDMVGLSRTRAGSVVGWILNGDGDSVVDFGVFLEDDSLAPMPFINGRYGSILLDFNVDGVIWDKIDEDGVMKWR
jgi:hypothetical protein